MNKLLSVEACRLSIVVVIDQSSIGDHRIDRVHVVVRCFSSRSSSFPPSWLVLLFDSKLTFGILNAFRNAQIK